MPEGFPSPGGSTISWWEHLAGEHRGEGRPRAGVHESTRANVTAGTGCPWPCPFLAGHPRTMLNVLLLCYGLLQGIQAILTSDLSHGHLQKMSAGLYGADRARYSSLLRKVKEVAVEPAGESGAPRPLLAHPGPQNRSGSPHAASSCPAVPVSSPSLFCRSSSQARV